MLFGPKMIVCFKKSKVLNVVWAEKDCVQGASKKMSDSDFSLKSVPGVGFYFFRGVSESEV